MRRRENRIGAAAVEFAVVAPLLCMMILGTVEVGRALQVEAAMVNAVREGARAYADSSSTVTLNGTTYTTGTSSYAIAVTKYCLINANIGFTSSNVSNVNITTSTTSTTVSGVSLQMVSVSGSVAFSRVAYFTPFFISGNLSSTITMKKSS
jgi:Flp pilus assembly protein TadG